MKQFLEAIKLILSSIGIDVLESKKVLNSADEQKVQEKIYEFSIKGAKAKMINIVKNRPSVSNAIINMRHSLI